MKIRSLYPLLLFIPVLFFSCAKQTSPTGGPKDTIPPVMIESYPRKNQLNFKDNKVELTFNEYVNLDNPKEKILITPDVGKDYEINAKKKTVVLTFKDPLTDTTTYSINFRESVKDITEKNPVDNLKLAFSTGSYIDSLRIDGKVIDPLTNKDVKDATVALYQQDTFLIFKHKPSYISKTNEKGLFSIENLKPGTYSVYAFDDKNRNLVVDSRTEGYAFMTTAITLHKNVETQPLKLIKLDARNIKLTSAKPYNTYFNIKLSKGVNHYQLSTTLQDSIYSILGEDKASIKVYNTIQADSFQIQVTAWDSLLQKVDSTVYVKFLAKKSTPENFLVAPANWRVIPDKGKIEGSITYNKPIFQINLDSIFYVIDSLRTIHFTPADYKIDPEKSKINFSKTVDKALLQIEEKTTSRIGQPQGRPSPKDVRSSNLKKQPDQEPQQQPVRETPTTIVTDSTTVIPKPKPKPQIQNLLYLGTAAIISIEADSSAQKTETLRPRTLEETGIIRVQIQTEKPAYVVQLLDKATQVIHSYTNTSKIAFEDLAPADYQIRIIVDLNADGKWSPGNPYTREPTEDIIFYQNEKKNQIISLKANWEIGPLLITF